MSNARVQQPTSGPLAKLAKAIKQTRARIGVIGLGYVGLPLAVEFAKAGFRVTGIDLDARRVAGVNQAKSYIPDVPSSELAELVRAKRLTATTKASVLSSMDVVIVCVPTPLRKSGEPDISFILSSGQQIADHMHAGMLVVLESTTYPGTTDEVMLPMLEAKGFRVGKEFALAFSPERVDPGNGVYTTRTIPKVIGGHTPVCGSLAAALYAQAVQRVVSVSSTKVAEMVKLLENTFRAVNIGLVNEIALICNRLGLNVWEVIDGAKTKPFGFMPFYPGPGIGGHCIPSDPMYLAWKARLHGFDARFIQLADQTNRYMPHYVVERVAQSLNEHRKSLNGSKVFVLGLAYKKDVNDTRDSPAYDIVRGLQERGAIVWYHDPYIPAAKFDGTPAHSTSLTAATVKAADCVLIVTNHTNVDYAMVAKHAKLIVDTRNQYGRVSAAAAKKIKTL